MYCCSFRIFCVFDTKKITKRTAAGDGGGDAMRDTLKVKLYNQLYKFIKLPIFKYAVV